MLDDTGLTIEQTDAAAWTVADNIQAGGPRAVGLMMAVAWNSRLPLLAWKIPGMAWLLDHTYEVIAKNRYRFPGDTAWCVANDGDCTPRSMPDPE